MTIANAATVIAVAGLLAVATPRLSKPEEPTMVAVDEPGDYASAPCADDIGTLPCMPTFYTISCFDRSDREECLRIELEDQAVAYSTGVEVYHRPVRLHRLPEPVHWMTLVPPPFVCHVLL
jgi:hypothetical protein